MKAKDRENVRELGDIAFTLHGMVCGYRVKAGETPRAVRKDMRLHKQRIEELLEELGL